MRCPLLLVVLLGAAHAVPFFRVDLPEHRSDPVAGAEVLPEEVAGDQGAVFAFQLPKIDLSAILKPLRVFAGVNVDHPPAIGERVEPNCVEETFDLTDEEFDVVMDCQKLFAGSDVEIKECILTKLPKTSVELRDFLDRPEYGVAKLSSSLNLALVDGEFTQNRSVQFRLCPIDEVNSIDVVEEVVPVEVVNPDRVDVAEPEVVIPVSAPEAVVPPSRPVFQFPPFRLPDFGQIFSQAFGPVFRPAAPEEGEQSGLGLFGSPFNPFAVHRPVPQPEGQQGFFSALFPQIPEVPPQRTDVDLNDCTSRKFNVTRFVFNVANRCQYANDYRRCLSMDLADNEDARELVEFAADSNYSVVASSFSSYQTSINFKSTRQNVIDLRRCANIPAVEEEVTSEPVPEATQDTPTVPETVPEEVPSAPEEYPEQSAAGAEVIPEVIPETPVVVVDPAVEVPEVAPETPELAPEAPELAPETPEIALEVAPETPEVAPEVAPEAPELVPETPEKQAAEAAKAATKVENPAEETKALEPEGIKSQSGTSYEVAEP